MIRTPIMQPVHPLELSYVELEILAKKALFRFSNIDIEVFQKNFFFKNFLVFYAFFRPFWLRWIHFISCILKFWFLYLEKFGLQAKSRHGQKWLRKLFLKKIFNVLWSEHLSCSLYTCQNLAMSNFNFGEESAFSL